jgi:alpha-tubulin suppressor-like RCC1 family protein
MRVTPRHLALVILALACGGKDAHVGCSPTLTCSLDDARFDPPAEHDAGPPACEQKEHRCRAETIAAGRAHTCAIAPAGELLCWGDGSQGQLGDGRVRGGLRGDGGNTDDDGGADAVPTPGASTDADLDAGPLIPVLDRATAVAAGGAHSCAIVGDGRVFCWGRGTEGQVDGVPTGEVPVRKPLEVVGVGKATDISAGEAHTCAVTERGVVCWGSARHGQIGVEVGGPLLLPGLVPGTEGAVEVSAGARHTCARLESRRVSCWGEQFDNDGEMRANAEARAVAGLDDAIEIAAGAGFTCALQSNGKVVCWGLNDAGQLGDGTKRASATPVEVQGLELSLAIATGGAERDGELTGHACAVTKSFFVQCWGRNREGQLGVGSGPDATRAAVVRGLPGEEDDEPFLPDVTAIVAGGFHTCSIDHDGPVICWGDDSLGQLDASPKTDQAFGRPNETRLFSGSR